MYIESCGRYYTASGEQRTRSALFLMLVSSKDRPTDRDNFRAVVRKVAMQQCGHWMMGTARMFGKSYTLSGSYGDDGLTMTVDDEIFEKCMPVPDELYEAWNKGGGHNSCGSEAEAFEKWAWENIDRLRNKKVKV